jgi:hypothetical protein
MQLEDPNSVSNEALNLYMKILAAKPASHKPSKVSDLQEIQQQLTVCHLHTAPQRKHI